MSAQIISIAAARAARVAATASPAGVDAVCRSLRKPATEWFRAYHQMELDRLTYHRADQHRFCLSIELGKDAPEVAQASAASQQAFRVWQGARFRQLFIAARAAPDLRWKERTAKQFQAPTWWPRSAPRSTTTRQPFPPAHAAAPPTNQGRT